MIALVDLCKFLGLEKHRARGRLSQSELAQQIVSFLLRKKASVDATLQKLRGVKNGVNGEAAQRRELEKDIKMKDQSPDVVVLIDLCHSLDLPIAKLHGGALKRPELVDRKGSAAS